LAVQPLIVGIRALLDYGYMKQVPFFANTPDDTHCVQASFRIMLKYFRPEQDFSFEQLDKMSQKQPGLGTWWPPMLMELRELGFLVKNIEGFDYQRFYKEGEAYVKSIYPPETAEYYLKRSNLAQIKPMVPKFLKTVGLETRPATIGDVDALLSDGWLVGVDLNSRALNDRPGYAGHMVVIFDSSNDNFWLHDPGLPPHPNRQVSRQKLSEAWFWSGRENAGLMAVKSA
jgi:hypothetical protein